jgi:phosphopantetheine adenylyltransferase
LDELPQKSVAYMISPRTDRTSTVDDTISVKSEFVRSGTIEIRDESGTTILMKQKTKRKFPLKKKIKR